MDLKCAQWYAVNSIIDGWFYDWKVVPSRAPQDSVFIPLLSAMHINNLGFSVRGMITNLRMMQKLATALMGRKGSAFVVGFQ